MKAVVALLSIVFLTFAGSALAAPPAVPASAKAAVATALAGVNKSDAAAVKAAILKAIKESDDPEADAAAIVAAAVQALSASGLSPGTLASVLGTMVGAVAEAYPSQAAGIVTAAVTSVPSDLQNSVVPAMIAQALEGAPADVKATILTAAISAAGDNSTLVAALNQIASENGIDPTTIVVNDDTGDDGFGPSGLTTGPSAPVPSSGGGGGGSNPATDG